METKYITLASSQPRLAAHTSPSEDSPQAPAPTPGPSSLKFELVLVGSTYRLQAPSDISMTTEEIDEVEYLFSQCASRSTAEPSSSRTARPKEHVQVKADIRIKNDEYDHDGPHGYRVGAAKPSRREPETSSLNLDLNDEDGDNESDDDGYINDGHGSGGGDDDDDDDDDHDDDDKLPRASATSPGVFLDGAVCFTSINYMDVDHVFNVIFSRLGPLPQNPCSSTLSLLLNRVESTQRKDFPFATKHKGAVPPAWWPDWLLPYGSPVRMRTEDKKKAITFIFLMPFYCHETTKKKLEEQNLSTWQELLQKALEGAILTTGYPKRKNALGEDDFDEKRDNTTESELEDRKSLIDVLLKIAADVEWVVEGLLDPSVVRSMPQTPPSLRRMMYGKGRGRRNRRATNTHRSGKRAHSATLSPPPSPSVSDQGSRNSQGIGMSPLPQKRPRVLKSRNDNSLSTCASSGQDADDEVLTDVDEPQSEACSPPRSSSVATSHAATTATRQATLSDVNTQVSSTSTSFSSTLPDAVSPNTTRATSFQCPEQEQAPPSAGASSLTSPTDQASTNFTILHKSADGMRGLFVPEGHPSEPRSQQPILQSGGFYRGEEGPVLEVPPASEAVMQPGASTSSPRLGGESRKWPYPDQKVYYEPRYSGMVSDMPFELGGEGYQNGYWRPYTDHIVGCVCHLCQQKPNDD